MAPGAEAVARALRDWLAAHPEGALAVGFSGGPDSTALLAVAAGLPEARARGLRALHVDHGLHPQSRDWARHCERVAARLGLRCAVLGVAVRPGGSGLEAAARRARYEALAAALGAGEWLLTAHHAEDQAETVLLRLLRGAPPPLLAGMPPRRPLGRGFLARPLLALPRSALAAALAASGLPALADPANLDRRLDRGWLRSRVIPALAERWPRWAEGVTASAAELGTALERSRGIAGRLPGRRPGEPRARPATSPRARRAPARAPRLAAPPRARPAAPAAARGVPAPARGRRPRPCARARRPRLPAAPPSRPLVGRSRSAPAAAARARAGLERAGSAAAAGRGRAGPPRRGAHGMVLPGPGAARRRAHPARRRGAAAQRQGAAAGRGPAALEPRPPAPAVAGRAPVRGRRPLARRGLRRRARRARTRAPPPPSTLARPRRAPLG
ncbi:MAG: tRNA lysidine(34) synthetase TilS [Xanthomonadales bacterium]|nr:tRNA lysidine(34) synthetase TilS [Xanthomonadales bacterium]